MRDGCQRIKFFERVFMNKLLRCIFHVNTLRTILLLCLACFSLDVFAAGATETLTISSVQTHISAAVGDVATVIMDVATISGAGFVFASFFKFHQHKLNPTQVPLSNGVTLLLVGAGLCVFPHLIGTTSKAIFDTGVSQAGSGTAKSILVGST